MKVVIFSPGAQCNAYVANNLMSIATQTYDNFILIVVNDASSDKTGDIINEFTHDRLKVYTNSINKGWLANAVEYLSPHVTDDCIVVSVDLDDWLAHNRVIEQIVNIYKEKDPWITYGSLVTCHGNNAYDWEPEHRYDDQVWVDRNFRGRLNYFSHLRTFRGFLWNKINKEDLKYNGT